MTITELIERKRDGGRLTELDIAWLIGSYTRGEIPDYQMSALLMAVYFNGLDDGELGAWTEAMLHSGDVLDLSQVTGPKVDKHSTGGVGDKVSIPLAPMVAACGAVVPMISGRGLGHTGGTLDKLESIPGFTTTIAPGDFNRLIAEHGVALAGQSDTLVPADRLLYALRDVTGTVPSIPLIASSITSKKLAEGLDALVLDVKVGRGAFMKDVEDARRLAETMVRIGQAHNTRFVALLTDMDHPLGREVGNANEIAESIEVLRGRGPQDLVELVQRIGGEMLMLGGLAADPEEARQQLVACVDSGAAITKFEEIIEAQGGDPAVLDDPKRLPRPGNVHVLAAPRPGYVAACDALAVGRAGVRLGAGRARKEDDIDRAVGFTILAKPGDPIEAGEPLARIGYNDEARLRAALEVLETAWEIVDEPPEAAPLVIEEVR